MTPPVFKSGQTATIVVNLPLDGDDVVTPTLIMATLLDEAGALINSYSISPPSDGADTVAVVIDGADNTLQPASRRGARSVEITFTTDAGVFVETTYYLIENTVMLAVLDNSFVTYPESLMVRADLPRLDGWDASGDEARIAALTIAHTSMCGLRYRYRVGLEGQTRIADLYGVYTDGYGRIWVNVLDIGNVKSWEWADYPNDFKTALRRAQVVEADNLLRGDPIGDKRRAGIISESIGESKMFLRSVPDVQLPISREALTHLRGYLTYAIRIGRGS